MQEIALHCAVLKKFCCMHLHIYICNYLLHTHTCLPTYTCTCTCTYTHTHIYTHDTHYICKIFLAICYIHILLHCSIKVSHRRSTSHPNSLTPPLHLTPQQSNTAAPPHTATVSHRRSTSHPNSPLI